jgi:hypothetical protein
MRMNHLKHLSFLIMLALLMSVLMLAGCGSDTAGDHYVIEAAPGVRITAEALEIMLDSGEPQTLTYTVRTS